ncbi:MAG: hypothetical protein A3B91_04025 [Candidatus Yanofskybacteria bacterium RIFCSPHIGHO2_02_FULL_41_29]|uniref:Uncharacterized protein n=1 Tax=Candidatus Yanofskybacteria bacterium RIFCSPHIGHO2_01_FULL_41_53 TaxID=1802663 RepID=A0A1F8EML3_9BACT|nr:MAG: hypothetical protein A2650_04805 [Candidatus Yanofskybacteria bacterium RIFCSPHIGHO2_01_FULL_41_53]OGN12615.1 MAG: hypothetical protein A3B91_04025 [Candidatus Yanofskybacteria bacterium RIFCSPHIGHO2_02_FULL_41_29]OGN17787.1 MAG: hypothetical protein A3F48_02475 [Candidatus Yanofskybacteria bacterium RIFCSPHIGHO2_12_FULL_41_9]OGN24846.1 MAG: hypothetical protein A2916_04490 [Candidatus Yanofskybacteria bacterium RIFCSPLOWO2_01_FULL_41_67]OGN28997.1 MAG: hypothetical protein A3H54_03295 
MRKNTSTIKEKEVILWINFALFGVVLLLTFYYIMMANNVTAKSYKVQTLRDKIESLVEVNSVLMSKKIATESQAILLEFAKAKNLVEARNIVYIFENTNVALQK